MELNLAYLESSPRVRVQGRKACNESLTKIDIGLAQAAVHRSGSTALLPASLFEGSAGVDVLGSRLASGLVINDTISPEAGGPSGTHALTILARILSDHRFHERKAVEQFLIYQTVMDELGDILRDYADQWSLDMKRPGELQHKIEELVWANTIIYGIGGWTKGEDLNADFLLYVKHPREYVCV